MVETIADHLGAPYLKRQAHQAHRQLQTVMRTFGRTCRGQQKIFVGLVRQTERQLLTVGGCVGPLACKALLRLYEDTTIAEAPKARLHRQLQQATGHYESIERQSRRLTQGKKLSSAKRVNAYDPTIAPIVKGKSNGPVQFGKKPGLIAEMATGFIFGLHLPPGNPDDASYMMPLIEQAQQARAAMATPRKPRIQSVAADLAFRPTDLRGQLHRRGILTVGIPSTIEPLPRTASPQQVQAVQQSMPFPKAPSAHQVQVATACGYRRPLVESLIEQLAHRGGTQLKYKGHRGAFLQTVAAILAHNAATLKRIEHQPLTQRAQRFRRLFRLKPLNSLQNNAPLN